MRVLELGNYIVPAYAGMILAEQGHTVRKWTIGTDPILGLYHGAELWAWINAGKVVEPVDLRTADLPLALAQADVVIDNLRASTLERWGLDPDRLARAAGIPWVSMRADVGERSFDVVSQARSWREYVPWLPFYVGDTTGGLWLAFKALSAVTQGQVGHHALYQASLMQKLIEGELVIDAPMLPGSTRWDEPGTYGDDGSGASVLYRGDRVVEPVRDRAWKLRHLHHVDGRMNV